MVVIDKTKPRFDLLGRDVPWDSVWIMAENTISDETIEFARNGTGYPGCAEWLANMLEARGLDFD